LILVGYAGAFRRSELAAIDLAHLSLTKDGLVINLHRSKTDQEAAGRKVGIPFGKDEATCRSARCNAGSSNRASPPVLSFAGSTVMTGPPAAGSTRTASAGF
jgi:hypothetical protein